MGFNYYSWGVSRGRYNTWLWLVLYMPLTCHCVLDEVQMNVNIKFSVANIVCASLVPRPFPPPAFIASSMKYDGGRPGRSGHVR